MSESDKRPIHGWRRAFIVTLFVVALIGIGYVAGSVTGRRSPSSEDMRSIEHSLSDIDEIDNSMDEFMNDHIQTPEFQDSLDRMPMKKTEEKKTIVPAP